MCTTWLRVFGVAIAMTACTNTSTGNPNHGTPILGDLRASTFAVIESGATDCSAPASPDASKLSPNAQALRDSLGADSDVFVVSLNTEIDAGAYPLPTGRDGGSEGPGEDPVYLARAEHIARLQGCAIEEAKRLGGTYLHSFLLINAFSVRLTAEQALSLTAEPSVRLVEQSETQLPPP